MLLLLASQQKLQLMYQKPASDWETQALPVGNGFVGGMIFGDVKKDHMQYNEKTFWSGGPNCGQNYTYGNRDVWQTVKKIQELQQKHEEVPNNMFNEITGNSVCFGAYQNFGDIWLEFDHDISAVSNYERVLDLEHGIHTVKYTKGGANYTRETFASYPHKAIVQVLRTDDPAGMNVVVSNEGVHGGKVATENSTVLDGNTIKLRGQLTKGAVIGQDGNVGNELIYESRLKVISQDGTMNVTNTNQLGIYGAKKVIMVLIAATNYKNEYPNYRGDDPSVFIERAMRQVDFRGYDALLQVHLDDYTDLYNRAQLNLGPFNDTVPTDVLLKSYAEEPSHSLEVLFFQYGRYLMISSSRTGSLPANLQGIWNHALAPPWNSDYHFNVNIQMNYWATDITGLSECNQPLVDYLTQMVIPGRQSAKQFHGLDGKYGWSINTMNSPFGVTAVGWSFDWGWAPSANAWICQNIWEYYQFTQNTELLREQIYPIMREAAYFWTKFLIPYNHTDGEWYYVSSPSFSPEHGPRTVATTFDQQLIRQLFNDTMTAIDVLGLTNETEFYNELKEKHAKLFPTQIGQYGQIMEWIDDIDDPNDHHRHCSQLVGLYPGKEINKDTKELFDAAKVSLVQRSDEGTGWSMANKINLWARLLDADHAHNLLGNLLREHVNDNLFDEHPPFQIDGNFGATSAVAEILVQSHMGYISIIPSLPNKQYWKSGSFTGIRARGNFEVSASWTDGKLVEAKIKSNAGKDLVIEHPGASKMEIYDGAGNRLEKKVLGNDRISVSTVAYEVYTFK